MLKYKVGDEVYYIGRLARPFGEAAVIVAVALGNSVFPYAISVGEICQPTS